MKNTVLFGYLLASSAFAMADAGSGKQLHDAHCMQCHDSSVYTRPDRFVGSLDALGEQVHRCHKNAGAQWSEDQLNSVVQYLNQQYYKFE